jgi:hypothetical protein
MTEQIIGGQVATLIANTNFIEVARQRQAGD